MFEVSFSHIIVSLLFLYILRWIQVKFSSQSKKSHNNAIMIIFGSGGHTSEMLMIMKDFKFKEYKNIYLLKASSDVTSQKKFDVYLKQNGLDIDMSKVTWIDIPRSREVKQSYLTSILTTMYSIFYCYFLLTFKIKKIDLLITNGPGTCIPVVYSLYLNKILLINPGFKLIFIESFCRVYYLSLTGKLLYFIADRLIVHWKTLAEKYKRVQFYGQLI